MIKKLFFVVALIVYACNEKQKQEVDQVESQSSKVDLPPNEVKDSLIIEESHFPNAKEIVTYDTLIEQLNVHISITKTSLDLYVTDEFESDGKLQVHKYHDYENRLIIKQNGESILDTTLIKESFQKYAGKEFLEIANFHNYWFRGIEDNRVVFFGTITKPETDWTVPFYHHYDLSSRILEFEEYLEEDI